MALEIGQAAPDFTLPRSGGGSVTLSALRGRPVVLFFYPKDDTPGCTVEAIEFTGLKPRFDALGAEVFGVSAGTAAAKDKFAAKAGLQVPLLADESTATLQAWGLWAEKSMYGRTYMGIPRTTVLVDAEGRVARIWPVSKIEGHAEEVLAAVAALGR